MSGSQHFTSVRFRNYKALKNFSVSLRRLNVLVGPNNCGKSTILGAFRILAEGIRRARFRKPELIRLDGGTDWGYRNRGGEPPDLNRKRIHRLRMNPIRRESSSVYQTGMNSKYCSPRLASATSFVSPGENLSAPQPPFAPLSRRTIGFVPVLGPVEHDEPLYQREAARLALLTHRASRNFRNIWYHFPEAFEEFRELIPTALTADSSDISRSGGICEFFGAGRKYAPWDQR